MSELSPTSPTPIRAVLFDRDGTLVVDVPYNGDPTLVQLMPGAQEAVAEVRAAGLRTAVVSNQSGIGRGLLSPADVDAVNRRVDELVGPLEVWTYCPHLPADACSCRKPEPGLILEACRRLGVRPEEAVVVGDIGADVGAAAAAGSLGILVPTEVTRAEEIAAAPIVAVDLAEAITIVLDRAVTQTAVTG